MPQLWIVQHKRADGVGISAQNKAPGLPLVGICWLLVAPHQMDIPDYPGSDCQDICA
jgi:hypothetical protein